MDRPHRPPSRQVRAEQITDAFDRPIRRRKGANHFRIVSVGSHTVVTRGPQNCFTELPHR